MLTVKGACTSVVGGCAVVDTHRLLEPASGL